MSVYPREEWTAVGVDKGWKRELMEAAVRLDELEQDLLSSHEFSRYEKASTALLFIKRAWFLIEMQTGERGTQLAADLRRIVEI